MAINCAAIPENLLETELFGHEKGAFTGAVARKPGKFELAHHGTLFLDEIGDLPLALQAKILRALEERRFERVGGTQSLHVDVRIVAATNKQLRAGVAAKQFREDLFFRLSVFPITIPPLRDRPEDIPILARHFAERFSRELKKKAAILAPSAIEELQKYHWPGNVRELQNCMERAVILSESDTIHGRHLNLSLHAPMLAGRAEPMGRVRSVRHAGRRRSSARRSKWRSGRSSRRMKEGGRRQGPRRRSARASVQEPAREAEGIRVLVNLRARGQRAEAD